MAAQTLNGAGLTLNLAGLTLNGDVTTGTAPAFSADWRPPRFTTPALDRRLLLDDELLILTARP